MKICIIIPAHNEEAFIQKTLLSLTTQTVLPDRIVVVDDQSTDQTASKAQAIAENHNYIFVIRTKSSEEHLPGSKVVHAFQKGLESLDQDFDIYCKFDADLIFPENYLERIVELYQNDPQVGMVGGFCQIMKDEKWELESLTDRDHIRGALKSYRKACFREIGGLKPSMGWDTVDELLAQYHGWKINTDPYLLVKHLRPTGMTYGKKAKWKQGEAFYKLRYGLFITAIASVKLAVRKRKPDLLFDYMRGYFRAKKAKLPYLVSKSEGAFIRRLRYKKMLKKLF